MIPIITIAIRIKKATTIVLVDMMISDTNEIVPDTNIVIKKIETTHRIVFLCSFLEADGSDLDKGIIPFMCLIMTATNRINLTA